MSSRAPTELSPGVGVGVVHVPGLEPLFEPGVDLVDVVEIEPETLWRGPAEMFTPHQLLVDVERHAGDWKGPRLVHSVGFGMGGSARPTAAFLNALAATVRGVQTPWVSAHLAVTHADRDGERVGAGFMLPPLQTRDGVAAAARNLRRLAASMPVPVAIENGVNYLAPRRGELTDGAFLASVLEAADCGLVLDLHNLWTNECNGRESAREVVRSVPLDRVWEIHVAGGFNLAGYRLDAHSGAVPDPVMELAAEVVSRCRNLRAIVFEIFPSFVPGFGVAAVAEQLAALRELRDLHASRTTAAPALARLPAPCPRSADPQPEIAVHDWDAALVRLAGRGDPASPLEQALCTDRSLALVRWMVWRFRASAIVATLPALTRLVLLTDGPARLQSLLSAYFADHPPSGCASLDSLGFLAWLPGACDLPHLDAVIAYEDGRLCATLEERPILVRFDRDPRPLLEALSLNRLPGQPESGCFDLEVYPHGHEVPG